MIDWGATKAEFGTITIDSYRPKVVCKCDECCKKQIITIRVKAKVTDSQMEWLCPKCVGEPLIQRGRTLLLHHPVVPRLLASQYSTSPSKRVPLW